MVFPRNSSHRASQGIYCSSSHTTHNAHVHNYVTWTCTRNMWTHTHMYMHTHTHIHEHTHTHTCVCVCVCCVCACACVCVHMLCVHVHVHVCIVRGVAGTVVNILARSNKYQETSSTAHIYTSIAYPPDRLGVLLHYSNIWTAI